MRKPPKKFPTRGASPDPVESRGAKGIPIAQQMCMNARVLAVGQGAFYLLSGLWPIVHYRSFEKVTGPKEDDWLAKTVGGLIAVTGASILAASLRPKEVPAEVAVVGAGHALVLGTSSGYYASRGRISKIYLLDSLSEYALVAAWLLVTSKPGSISQSSDITIQKAA